MGKLFIMILLSGCVAICMATTSAQMLINGVNESDKGDFLKYHLTLALNKFGNIPQPLSLQRDTGVPDEKIKKFTEMNTPDNFHANLFKWASNDLSMTPAMMTTLVTVSVVCFSNSGNCYNPNEVGSLCCPF